MSQKIEIEHNGRTFWYYHEHEKALTKFRKEKETACRLHWNKKSCDIAMDEDKQEKYPHANSLIERMIPLQDQLDKAHFEMNSHLVKYPVLPDQAFPTYRNQLSQLRESSQIGKPIIFGTGGGIGTDWDVDKFKQWWDRDGLFFQPTYSNRSIWLDFGSSPAYYGTYPRKMLLLL